VTTAVRSAPRRCLNILIGSHAPSREGFVNSERAPDDPSRPSSSAQLESHPRHDKRSRARLSSALHERSKTWSNCLVVDGVAYVAGMTARGSGQGGTLSDEYAQAREIFGKIRHLVEAVGGSMADVVKVTIFVTDITQREKVWRARREFFTGNFPTSTLVQVAALADPSLKVEINAVAHIGTGKR